MKYLFLSLFAFAILITSCSAPQSNENSTEVDEQITLEETPQPTLSKVWETDTTLITVESVLYHESSNVIFAACINGTPLDKDDNGYIAQLDLEGNIINEKWAADMDAPKGMGINGDKLYVTNITELVEIELSSGEITNRWEVEGSGFLNDITIAKDGVVYFTDSKTNKIHALQNGEVSTWLEGTEITGMNGLLAEDNGLMLASMGSSNFVRIDWDTKAIVEKADSVGAGDGVVADGEGSYFVSSWAGEVFHINGESGEKLSLLNTQADKIQSADITYIPKEKLLLVPTFFKNSVVAYRVD